MCVQGPLGMGPQVTQPILGLHIPRCNTRGHLGWGGGGVWTGSLGPQEWLLKAKAHKDCSSAESCPIPFRRPEVGLGTVPS